MVEQQTSEKTDYQKLNNRLRLYAFHGDIGRALPLWLPNGAAVRSAIEDFLKKEQLKRGYQFVYTPHIGREELWETSEHLPIFDNLMYPPLTVEKDSEIERDESYRLRPMNCPFHILVFKAEPRSYRDLPLRIAEMGTVYRRELSGNLKEMLRVRGFTQDDAHIFCTEDQLYEELSSVIDLVRFVLVDTFGFDEFRVVRRLKYPSSDIPLPQWELAQKFLDEVLKRQDIEYFNDPGRAMFYGPKVDFEINDARGNNWVCSTIQLDILLARKFKLRYMTSANKKEPPYIIHRTLIGSFERFIPLLLEHYDGYFPFWVAPVQVAIIPWKEELYRQHADKIKEKLLVEIPDLRVRVYDDEKDWRIRIKETIQERIPYSLVIGKNEINQNTIAVRRRSSDKEVTTTLHEFVEEIKTALSTRK